MKLANRGVFVDPVDEFDLCAHLRTSELFRFRTKLCGRKALYGQCGLEDSCPFSHCLSWTRRNPLKHAYRPQLCPNVKFEQIDGKMKVTSYCLRGRICMFAHTKEEQMYHPLVYKTQLCNFFHQKKGCDKYFCPFAHGMKELTNPDEVNFRPLQGPEFLLDCVGIRAAKWCGRKCNKRKNALYDKDKNNLFENVNLASISSEDFLKVKEELLNNCNTSEKTTVTNDIGSQQEVVSYAVSTGSDLSASPVALTTSSSFVSSFSTSSIDLFFDQLNNSNVCNNSSNDESELLLLDKQALARETQLILSESKAVASEAVSVASNSEHRHIVSEPPPGFDKIGDLRKSDDVIDYNAALGCVRTEVFNDCFLENENSAYSNNKVNPKSDWCSNNESDIEGFFGYSIKDGEIFENVENAFGFQSAAPSSPSCIHHTQQVPLYVNNKGDDSSSSNCSTRASRNDSTASMNFLDAACASSIEQSSVSLSEMEGFPPKFQSFSSVSTFSAADSADSSSSSTSVLGGRDILKSLDTDNKALNDNKVAPTDLHKTDSFANLDGTTVSNSFYNEILNSSISTFLKSNEIDFSSVLVDLEHFKECCNDYIANNIHNSQNINHAHCNENLQRNNATEEKSHAAEPPNAAVSGTKVVFLLSVQRDILLCALTNVLNNISLLQNKANQTSLEADVARKSNFPSNFDNATTSDFLLLKEGSFSQNNEQNSPFCTAPAAFSCSSQLFDSSANVNSKPSNFDAFTTANIGRASYKSSNFTLLKDSTSCRLQHSEGVTSFAENASVISALDAAGSKILEESADGVAILKAWGRLA